MDGVCAPAGFVPVEVVSGVVDYVAPVGVVSGAVLVAGTTVVVVVMFKCIHHDPLIIRPNRVFITSLEPETEKEIGDCGLVWLHLSDGFATPLYNYCTVIFF